MYLFVFRRVYNPEAKYREQPEQETEWPLIYAVHLTRENITAEEWEAMMERVGKKDNAYFTQFVEISRQVDEQLRKEGLKVSDNRFFSRQIQLTKELGAVPGSTYRALEEVLVEDGFTVLKPENLTYQLPLRDYDKERNAEMAAFYERVHGKAESQ